MAKFKRILIVRTDRIGDVLLSTPVIQALRKKFPQSFIAMMVRPYARDIVLGHPYLNEVIIYDKYGRQRSFWRTLLFTWTLRKKRFDLALILHPTNRAHLITFLAGIKTRIGFQRKLGFLLTRSQVHKKQEGAKHELEYTLELLHKLGVAADEQQLFMPIRQESEEYIKQFLGQQGVAPKEQLIALHPAASCPSKMWPAARFARVADQLYQEFKIKPVIISGPDDLNIGQEVIRMMRAPAVDAVGKTTVSQLASLFRRCRLFISNDSGPVHIATSQGVPVIAIFGRKQPGLSPRRWGPRGKGDYVLHKDVGCQQCLAHNCKKNFACLAAISEEEVLSCARKLLKHLFD